MSTTWLPTCWASPWRPPGASRRTRSGPGEVRNELEPCRSRCTYRWSGPGRAAALRRGGILSPADDPVGLYALYHALYMESTRGLSDGQGPNTLSAAPEVLHRDAASSPRGGRHPDDHRASGEGQLPQVPAGGGGHLLG